ncbi:MAG: hypothetical protein ACXWPM_09860 [Bdellovibrionota bacterium]
MKFVNQIQNRSWVLFATTVVAMAGCQPVSDPGPVASVSKNPGRALVCDPFHTGGSGEDGQGILGHLFYLDPALSSFAGSVSEIQRNSTQIAADFHFSDLNIPTRPFDEGFTAQGGEVIQTPSSETLYEYFSFHLESVLKLSEADAPGNYQLAVLSDDGSVVQLNPDGSGAQLWINNDGIHPSELGCASRVISMDASSRVPVVVDYYQGPRYHLALVLLWRRIADGASLSDAACGRSGNSVFFDPTQSPSAPSPLWLDMLARGWKVLAPGNYELAGGEEHRRCVDGSCFNERIVISQSEHGRDGDSEDQVGGNSKSNYNYTLAHAGVDPSSIQLRDGSGDAVSFTYNAATSTIEITEAEHDGDKLVVSYCLQRAQPSPTPSVTPSPSACPSPDPSPTPTISPSVSPTPDPSVSPSASPSVSPSPNPSPAPTCTGIGCNGGTFGV